LILSDYPAPLELISYPKEKIDDMINRVFLAREIYDISKELRYNSELKLYKTTGQSGTEIPEDAAKLLLENDIFIAITTFSLSHTTARKKATEKGIRGASCPGITTDMFRKGGAMTADYKKIEEYTNELINKLNQSSKGKINAPNGTNLDFDITKGTAEPDTGIITDSGDFSNLPAGEAYLAPKKGITSGLLVVSKGWYKDLEETMKFKIADGLVQEIIGGGKIGEKFNDLLFNSEYEEDTRLSRRNIAEIGIGTNPKAKNPENTLEAEKIKGTCHMAIGDNHTFSGGTVESDIHIDFVIPKTRLFLDDKEIKLN
jgi:leucyl aminopeptidase (aminopeptidase T)